MKKKCLTIILFCISLSVVEILSAASDPATQSLIATSTERSDGSEPEKEGESTQVTTSVPKIYQMHVKSNIKNRFAHTTIISKVKNAADKAQEAIFVVVLPETAFVSGFIMEVGGKNYTAYVKEKEEAKRTYEEAVASGFGAAHVAVSARDSNRFTVSVNIEPQAKAAFYLSYEQLLKREDNRYEQVINIHPGQPVPDLSIEVVITESRKITDLKAPPLRSGNEIGNANADLDPRADLEIVNDTSAIVRFSPNLERQKQLAHLLNTKEEEGLAGQFVVQYDVERDPQGGEVLIQDGYFVHFFAPSDLDPLPKHVVFVLDTSSSMHGQKIQQLREAMEKILQQLHGNDLFTLVEFNSNVKVWDLNNPDSSVWYPVRRYSYDPCGWRSTDDTEEVSFGYYKFPSAYLASSDNILKARETVSKLEANGGTDIYTALRVGLHLIELSKRQKTDSINRQPIIVFLTDGEPTVRVSSTTEITEKITELNSVLQKTPIFALSFGRGADKKFLQKLALLNFGFFKHIYDAADASLQLQDFYKQISSPLLAGVTFKYEPSVTSLTKTEFPLHFGGSEIIVAGQYSTDKLKLPSVDGWGVNGHTVLKPTIEQSVSNIERLWAYLTIQQLLKKTEASDKDQEELKKKALDLALEYSFVTPLSSLVVVKPNDTSAVDTEAATDEGGFARGSFADSGRRRGAPRSFAKKRIQVASGASDGHGLTAFRTDSYQLANRFAIITPGSPGIPAPRPIYTTPACPDFETSAGNLDLLIALPWLKDILNENGTINLSTGNYKLGENETISDTVSCPKTPLGGEGHCKLLHACPQVHPRLTVLNVLEQHFCTLKGEFAGVCCPDQP